MKDFESVKKTVGGNEGEKCHYTTRLDTYGCGCAHDCSYCFAKSLLNFRGLWNPKNPSIGDMKKISAQIRKLPRDTVTTLDDKLAATYEKASPPTMRIEACKRLQDAGYDVQMRISPFIPEYCDIAAFNALGIDKACVEFLRVNSWIKKWFDADYSKYTVKQGGYEHMPLAEKIKYIEQFRFKELTVCEDEDRAYEYWKKHVNHNPDDCCNLRRKNEAEN